MYERIATIEKGIRVYARTDDAEAVAFAKAFAKFRRGTTNAGAQSFLQQWVKQDIRNGFVGSGEWLYVATDGSGTTFRVVGRPNGSGFWGTDYDVARA